MNWVFEQMKNIESSHNVIVKLEVFADQTGDLYYSDNLKDTDLWTYLFSFIDISELAENLGNSDKFFTN